ncbi:MAG: TDP-N-acetylfucosamine:lipid II N-acetylfucosaminyltransferase [Bacteroidota bacterium]|nr:TDP-N-acetylfucosamine:lipid II N-acetylfucosaminyltransferase [Bacteroidota bacterium]
MIVHLFEDQKFVDITIENFENVSSGLNKYIVFSNNKELRYVSRKEQILILPNSSYKLDFGLIYKDCQLLIIHFLSPIKLYIMKNRPPNVQVIWSVWGSDAYDHFKNQYIYEPLTKKNSQKSLYHFFNKSWFYEIYHFLRYRVKPIRQELELLRTINHIITVLPYEFKIIKKEFGLIAKYIDCNYGVNKFNRFSNVSLGSSILIGNSATPTNNHLDVFDIIKSTNKRLLVPLNYGALGYRRYRRNIIVQGKRLFGDRFTPLTTYLPKTEYDDLLLSCNTAIMYHIRQQALGNIFNALFMGMRVFLNSKSLTYKYLKEEGVIVFDLEKHYNLLGVELDEDEKENNRNVVLRLGSRRVIKEKVKGIIDLHNKSVA